MATTLHRGAAAVQRSAIISGSGTVEAWEAGLFVFVGMPGEESKRHSCISIDLWGTLTEPVKGCRAFVLTAARDWDGEPVRRGEPAVGLLMGVRKGTLEAHAWLSADEFDHLRAMAGAGLLITVEMTVQERKHRAGLIRSLLFRGQAGKSRLAPRGKMPAS